MIVFPAIDLLDGQCVRLVKGEYNTAHSVAPDPLLQARAFREDGAVWLHTVDLNGAKDGTAVNADVIEAIVRTSGLKTEVGGGIRNMETVERYLSRGAARVILGSAALKDPAFTKEAVRQYGERIAVGIDCKEGKVSVSGWTEASDTDYLDFARQMEAIGVKTLIFTDISKDGTLSGPNLTMLKALSEAVSCDITASGGVRDIGHIRALRALGLYGAIAGKSLYSGTLSLKEALTEAEGTN